MVDNIQNSTTGFNFEEFKKEENGIIYWLASDLMTMLDYKDDKSFNKVIDRATKACISLNIPHYENFVSIGLQDVNGHLQQEFKLSRFACYLTVMNGNPQHVPVAAAQVYFAAQTRKFELYIQNSEEIERLNIRDELTEGTKTLNAVAKVAGVSDYAKFTNAGYRGLYNLTAGQLTTKRNLGSKANIQDYMGRTELAANLFRVTQTEERIKNKNIKGQNNLEIAHQTVGREVREIVIKNSGVTPENLPISKELPEVRKDLKKGYKKMLDLDSPKTKKKKG